MKPVFHFRFEKDWRSAPLAFWVHIPVPDVPQQWNPPAPREIPHQGYAWLCVEFEGHELHFSSPAQLDHFIDVLSSHALPTSRQLSSVRGLPAGPNGHWLSRLPAALKSPRKRAKLVQVMEAVRARVTPEAADRPDARDFRWA